MTDKTVYKDSSVEINLLPSGPLEIYSGWEHVVNVPAAEFFTAVKDFMDLNPDLINALYEGDSDD